MPYKWTGPYDWLADMTRSWEQKTLYSALCLVAEKCDPDDIQDIFQQEMEEDGYFDKNGGDTA